MPCEQPDENLQGGVWGFLNANALQHSRNLVYGSQELLQNVTSVSNVANIVSKIQYMILMMS